LAGPAHDPEGRDRGRVSAEKGTGAEQGPLAGAIEPLLGYLTVVARNLLADDKAGLERASDLVQLTVMAALGDNAREKPRVDDAGELKAWLRGIMLNVRRQLWRTKSPMGRLTGDEIRADTSSPSAQASREELAARMAQARSRLVEYDRRLLDWRHQDKLTFREIGERLGVTAVAAHKAHVRALRRLEDAFLEIAAAAAYRQSRNWLKAMHRGSDADPPQ